MPLLRPTMRVTGFPAISDPNKDRSNLPQIVANIRERFQRAEDEVRFLRKIADTGSAAQSVAALTASVASLAAQLQALQSGVTGGSGTSIVDFGSAPGAAHASVVVTGQTNVSLGSLVSCWIKPEATVDHLADEHMVETLHVVASSLVAGVGFTIHAFNTSQIHTPGGSGTLISGKWSVGWAYTR